MQIDIPGFELVEPLGAGGFGSVWLAHQPSVDRDVAVKVGHQPLGDDMARVRFERECRALGRLSGNPHIVTVHVVGVLDDGRPYLVLEYVGGGTLSDRYQQAPLGAHELSRVGAELCGALEDAHQAGILHRDIKPDNVLLRADGSAVLGDFGIAVLRDAVGTVSGSVTATLPFAAPEVLSGAPASASSDLYSVGATVLGAATRTTPFTTTTDQSMPAILNRVLTMPPPDLRALGYPDALAVAVERLMAKDPAARPAAAAEARALFDAMVASHRTALVGPPGSYRPDAAPVVPPPSYSPGPGPVAPQPDGPRRGSGLVLSLAAAALVVVIGIAGWAALRSDGDDRVDAGPTSSADVDALVDTVTTADTTTSSAPIETPSSGPATTTSSAPPTTEALGPIDVPLRPADAGLPADLDVIEIVDEASAGFCNQAVDVSGVAEERGSYYNDFFGNDQLFQAAIRFASPGEAADYLAALAGTLTCSSFDDTTRGDVQQNYTTRPIAIQPVQTFGDETRAFESNIRFENGFEVTDRRYVVRIADRIIAVGLITDERNRLDQLPQLMGLMLDRLGY